MAPEPAAPYIRQLDVLRQVQVGHLIQVSLVRSPLSTAPQQHQGHRFSGLRQPMHCGAQGVYAVPSVPQAVVEHDKAAVQVELLAQAPDSIIIL